MTDLKGELASLKIDRTRRKRSPWRWPLLLLLPVAAVFAIVVVAVARWRGLRALLGIVVAFAVLVVFLLPALRDGASAVPVSLV